jgi:hypothetical protein
MILELRFLQNMINLSKNNVKVKFTLYLTFLLS